MSRPRFIKPIPILAATLGVAASLGLRWSFAEPPHTQKAVPGAIKSTGNNSMTGSSREARLNFLQKPWSEVLQQVADQTGSELEMPEVPPGKFSRTDFGKHSREDAVRILNRDLAKLGYRLVEQNEKLVVEPMKRVVPEYAKHTARTVTPASGADVPPQRLPESNNIQRLSHEAPAEKVKTQPLRIQPSNRPAIDIARQVHLAFNQRSRLENVGPTGFPAFVVSHFDAAAVQAGESLFTMEIDTARNELIISGSSSVQQGLQQMIAKLDVNPLAGGNQPSLMIGEGKTVEVGQRLAQPIRTIAQAQQQAPDAAQAPPTPPAAPGADSGAQAAPLPAILGNLKGDVSIEAMTDLDLLILRGNEKDVEAVMEVIRAVEQMAVGSLPGIHLLQLQHVDSQSMSTLLNDVYAKMSELRTGNAQRAEAAVRVVPVVTPNAVLILAPENAMNGILDLADKLDQPIDPEHQIQIFRLAHAIASEAKTMLDNFYGTEPIGLGTRQKSAADARTNSLIVQARPRDLTEIAKFLKDLDSEQSNAVSQLKVIRLKTASAVELAEFLNNALQSALSPPRIVSSTGQQQLTTGAQATTAKAVILEFLMDEGQQIIRSGLLNDVRFNADSRTNTLLVTASEQSFQLIEELVRILDRPSEALAEIKVFTLTHADALDAVNLLNNLFNGTSTQQQGGGGGFGQNFQQQQQMGLGFELMGAQNSTNSLIPMRFSYDARTNSVVAIGGADALHIVEVILYRLDMSQNRNRQTTTIKLRNSPATDVAAAITDFLVQQRELATFDPTRISTSQLLEQEIIVTAEPVTNSLIISATPAYFPQIEELVKKLDAEPPQVMIQAMIVEVELDNTDEFGVELGFQDPVLFQRSLVNTVTGALIPGFNFNNQPLGNSANAATNHPSKVGTQGLTNFAVGRVNNELGYGGMVLSASSESVSVLVRALAARRNLRVLSRPQVMVLDNQLAQIQVGQVVPITNGVTITGTGIVSPDIEQGEAGIILTVTPRISPEGQIVMEVAAEKSLYNFSQGVPIYVDATTGNVVTAPVKDITTARTFLKVPDGQTVVMGGLITKTDQSFERKVPWLGDIPVVGRAFRYDIFEHRRTELLIFLTPRIVHSDADAELIKQVEAGRLHFFQDDVESLHGPIFGNPSGPPVLFQDVPPPLNLPPMLPPEQKGNPSDIPPPPQPAVPPAPTPTPAPPSTWVDPTAAEFPSTSKTVIQVGEAPRK